MATQEDISAVQNDIGPNASAEGWDETKISAGLDAGSTVGEVVLEYWESRMAETSELVNVSESGSSRNLADIHKHAVQMAKYYQDKNRDNQQDGGGDSSVRTGLGSITMNRV